MVFSDAKIQYENVSDSCNFLKNCLGFSPFVIPNFFIISSFWKEMRNSSGVCGDFGMTGARLRCNVRLTVSYAISISTSPVVYLFEIEKKNSHSIEMFYFLKNEKKK